MKGQRTPEEVKRKTVNRLNKGEELEDLAAELGVQPSTVKDWEVQSRKKPKKKVTTRKPTPRRNPTQDRIRELESQVDFWKDKYNELFYGSRNNQ